MYKKGVCAFYGIQVEQYDRTLQLVGFQIKLGATTDLDSVGPRSLFMPEDEYMKGFGLILSIDNIALYYVYFDI